ncbi:MAG: protease modulator HflK [Kiritimatiellia bacterium]
MGQETNIMESGQAALNDALRISFRLLRAVMLLLLVCYLATGVFVVRQHEEAFVLMLGKISGQGDGRLLGPGLHWTFPRPVAEVVRVPSARIQTLESDTFWYYVSEEDKLRGEETPAEKTLPPLRDGYTLSADANLLHSRWAVRYRISDPEQFLFGFSGTERALRSELDRAVIMASSRFKIDQAMRTEIEAFRSAVDVRLRERCRKLGLGVQVDRVDLLAVTPPRQVAGAFDAVVAAEQEQSRSISEARGYAARLDNEAQGEASRLRDEGEAVRQRTVNEVKASADYFTTVREKYVKNPDITAQVLLQDVLRRVLTGVDEKYVIHKNSDGTQELRLLLTPEETKPVKKK